MSPTGYREAAVGGTLVVARDAEFESLREIVAGGTVHAWASRQPGALALQGRGVAWATQLPSGADVVVRHSRHGGMLAALTGDLFLAPTRSPAELETSVRLRAAGVRTPPVIAYAVYRALGPLCRADVVTMQVSGTDLPAAWMAARGPAQREAIIDAVADLLRALGSANAGHDDLNAKNILLSHEGDAPVAWVIDVDRVNIDRSTHGGTTANRNAWRLHRSLAKWRAERGLDFSAADWDRLAAKAGGVDTSHAPWRI